MTISKTTINVLKKSLPRFKKLKTSESEADWETFERVLELAEKRNKR